MNIRQLTKLNPPVFYFDARGTKKKCGGKRATGLFVCLDFHGRGHVRHLKELIIKHMSNLESPCSADFLRGKLSPMCELFRLELDEPFAIKISS